jgi:hypothetical protein
MNVGNWESFDPTWLMELAREQAPERQWLPVALSRCTRLRWRGDAYMAFIDSARPNEPGSEWQFVENIVLEHPSHGELVLDILTEHRVGGVEFLARIR